MNLIDPMIVCIPPNTPPTITSVSPMTCALVIGTKLLTAKKLPTSIWNFRLP